MNVSPPAPVPWLAPLVSSPFKVKGVLYQGTLTYFEKQVPGGAKALLDVLAPGPLGAFMSQQFLASSWYEVMNVPALIAAEAHVMGLSEAAYLQGRTQWQATRDTAGAYSVLLRLAPTQLAAERLPRVMKQMFNFGQAGHTRLEKGLLHVRLQGFPVPLRAWMETVLCVYATTVMGACGAKDIHVKATPGGAAAPQDGFPMCDIVAELKWT